MKNNIFDYQKRISVLEKELYKQQRDMLNSIQVSILEKKSYTAKVLILKSRLLRKDYRIILNNLVKDGNYELADLVCKFKLNRELTYSEKSKIAKETEYPLEFCEDHFPERLAELAARGTARAHEIANQSIINVGHKARHSGNIL